MGNLNMNAQRYANRMAKIHKLNYDWDSAFEGYKAGYEAGLAESTHTSQEQLAAPAVVGQSEQLPCEHEERTMQGNGFTYVICSKCGEDL